MCGIFRFSSRGEIFSTSPAIQLKPSVVTCSLPRVAISCMPTQMPKNGRALTRTASVIASSMPSSASRPRRQSAKAPTPGSTMRSARNTDFGIARHHDLLRILHAPRGALERLRGRVQIAGAVIDDGNAHRDPPGSGNNPMMPPCGSGRRLRERLARNIAGRRRRAAIDRPLVVDEAALPGGPAIEEAALGRFLVIGDHDIELAPLAARQRPALQARRFKAHQDREQEIDEQDRAAAGAERGHAEVDRQRQHDPADQRQPQPVPDQPDHAGDRGPEMEAVAHEHELVGRREIGAVGHGGMHCVDRHRNSPPRRTRSAAELTLGGRHFARVARIDRNRRTQRPRQTLEAGFGDMMAVLAI